MKLTTEGFSIDEPSTGADCSPGVRLALAAIRGYRLCFSPYFGGACRFLPSCSEYAEAAVANHGVLKGSWLAFLRLARCHPLCAAGHDPVPVKQR